MIGTHLLPCAPLFLSQLLVFTHLRLLQKQADLSHSLTTRLLRRVFCRAFQSWNSIITRHHRIRHSCRMVAQQLIPQRLRRILKVWAEHGLQRHWLQEKQSLLTSVVTRTRMHRGMLFWCTWARHRLRGVKLLRVANATSCGECFQMWRGRTRYKVWLKSLLKTCNVCLVARLLRVCLREWNRAIGTRKWLIASLHKLRYRYMSSTLATAFRIWTHFALEGGTWAGCLLPRDLAVRFSKRSRQHKMLLAWRQETFAALRMSVLFELRRDAANRSAMKRDVFNRWLVGRPEEMTTTVHKLLQHRLVNSMHECFRAWFDHVKRNFAAKISKQRASSLVTRRSQCRFMRCLRVYVAAKQRLYIAARRIMSRRSFSVLRICFLAIQDVFHRHQWEATVVCVVSGRRLRGALRSTLRALVLIVRGKNLRRNAGKKIQAKFRRVVKQGAFEAMRFSTQELILRRQIL